MNAYTKEYMRLFPLSGPVQVTRLPKNDVYRFLVVSTVDVSKRVQAQMRASIGAMARNLSRGLPGEQIARLKANMARLKLFEAPTLYGNGLFTQARIRGGTKMMFYGAKYLVVDLAGQERDPLDPHNYPNDLDLEFPLVFGGRKYMLLARPSGAMEDRELEWACKAQHSCVPVPERVMPTTAYFAKDKALPVVYFDVKKGGIEAGSQVFNDYSPAYFESLEDVLVSRPPGTVVVPCGCTRLLGMPGMCPKGLALLVPA
jgi:hypothetical protein